MIELITLNEDQQLWAIRVGKERTRQSREKNYEVRLYTRHMTAEENDIEAAAAELSVAIYFGVEWNAGVNTFKSPDVGNMQVRHSILNYASLIIREADPQDEKYILVVGTMPSYKIIGWWRGDRREDKFVKAPNNLPPAWFIPQKELLSMNTLKAQASDKSKKRG